MSDLHFVAENLQMDQCRELVNTLATRQPNDERVVLLKAALLLQDKKPAKADELLAARRPQETPKHGPLLLLLRLCSSHPACRPLSPAPRPRPPTQCKRRRTSLLLLRRARLRPWR